MSMFIYPHPRVNKRFDHVFFFDPKKYGQKQNRSQWEQKCLSSTEERNANRLRTT